MPHRKDRGFNSTCAAKKRLSFIRLCEQYLVLRLRGGLPLSSQKQVPCFESWKIGAVSEECGSRIFRKVRENHRRGMTNVASRRGRMPTPVDYFRHRPTVHRFLMETADLQSFM
jgi:hypothetical protein